MPQTLLAILSMVLTTMFAVNQHRSVLTTQLGIVRQDLSLRTTSVATDIMDEISAMAFDEATKTDAVSDPNQLTVLPITGLDEYVGDFQESGGADDLDDFNGLEIQRQRTQGAHTLNFVVRPTVNYVTGGGDTVVDYVTKMKKVTLEVSSTDYSFADTIRVAQVFSCGSRCNW